MKKTIEEVRDYLLENRIDEHGDLDLIGLDFSNFEGRVFISKMKVKRDLFQSNQKVGRDLKQSYQTVERDLEQYGQKVKCGLYQGMGCFYKPKKTLKEITSEELEEMGYILED